MIKRITSLLIAIVFSAMIFAGCNSTTKDTNNSDAQKNDEVTDLQLVLLNHASYKSDVLKDMEGQSIEGHGELIDDKYKDHISGGNALVDELKGFTLVDFDDGNFTGFKAAAYTKGNNLVIVYCGTDQALDADGLTDLTSAVFDVSTQDGQAKTFAIDNAKKYKHYNLYITGYSLGGRLCYLGTEAVIDNSLGGNLKKVRTFNGLGVKEFFDINDSNLSNIHNLQTKFGDKTYDYIVEGDNISDENSHYGVKGSFGYLHIGTEFKVPCTNEIDTWIMKQHDLYSIIDYLLNNPAPAENNSSVKNLDSKSVLVVSDEDHNLIGEFINVSGDTRVNTWNTFVSKHPQVADPMDQGREYFSEMHITLFFLKDNEENVIDNKGVMNATGFGSDPIEWNDKYGEFDWMYTDSPETYEDDDFYILYDGEYYSGPADCHILNARLREYITLGSYEQDGNDGNGKEPIEWLVLSQDDDKLLVVSKYCLDYLTYPDDWTSNIVWETCSLRSYLNSDFYTDSFTEDEQQQIIRSENQNKASEDYYSTVDGNDTDDNVFLLSIDEVQKYLPAMTATESSKRAYGTDYLYDILKGHQYYGNVKTGEPVNWALRADIDTERNAEGVGRPREMVVYDSQITCMITTGGMRDPDGPLSVVRPAMWVKNTVSKHRNSEHTETAESESDVSDENPDDEISDKNTGNNSDWSDMYYHLIVDNNYSIEADDEYNTKITVNSDIPLALHDFDMDGTPELIIGYIGARLGLEVFTILGGNVVYAGGIGGKASFYSDNESYHGIFRNDSWSETQVLAYTGLKNGKLDQHEVLSGKFNQSTKEFDYSILDDTLYDVYLDCTTSDSDEISAYRQAKNELKLYYWRDIESDGWDSFVKYYGY